MKVDKFILGTAQFGMDYGINNPNGKVNKEEALRILDYAYNSGIRFVDTAASYGDSEQIINEFLSSRKDVKGLKIITKVFAQNIADFEKSLLISLGNLGIKKVDTLLFHSFSELIENSTSLIALCNQMKSKYFDRLGVSVYTNKELEKAGEIDEIDLIQLPFNLLDNESLRGSIVRKIHGKGKTVHTRSVFLQGLFFMNFEKFPSRLGGLKEPLSELRKLANDAGLTMHELSLMYPLSKEYIDGVIIGVDSLKQLKENLQLKNVISADIIQSIDKVRVSNPHLINPSLWTNQR